MRKKRLEAASLIKEAASVIGGDLQRLEQRFVLRPRISVEKGGRREEGGLRIAGGSSKGPRVAVQRER